ncbi:hypothetical protein Tco_0053862 [Tanacetum coccineum]
MISMMLRLVFLPWRAYDSKEEPIEEEPLEEPNEEGYYRCFIANSSKVAKPLASLTQKIRKVLHSNDIYMDSSKIEAMKNYKVAKPLASLTQKIRKYEWAKEQEESFQTLKDNLCDTPIFSLPDGSKEERDNRNATWPEPTNGKEGRQGKGRDSRNAAWPGPNNRKEGRYLVHSGADKTYYDLRDMYGGHLWRRILLPIYKAWSACVDHLISWWKTYFAALVGIAEGIENTAKTCILLIILKQTDKKYLADTNLHVHLEEIKVDKTLRFVEEPVEIIEHEVKSLKRSRILIVKSIRTRSEVMRIS